MSVSKLICPEDSVLIIIDIQEKFVPVIRDIDAVTSRSCFIAEVAKLFDVPIIVTEQNPSALGTSVKQIYDIAKSDYASRFEKITFSCWRDDAIKEAIRRFNRGTVLLAGIETPVCILQTGLDLLDAGFDVYLCVDAISARKELEHQLALSRLISSGAIAGTVETAAFEFMESAEGLKFKELLGLIKKWQTK